MWSTLLQNWRGLCARVMISSGVLIVKRGDREKVEQATSVRRRKKSLGSFDRTGGVYINAIGQPQGIPNEFKARNEIAVGFESIIPAIGINKNVEWINYIYYNQQRFLNYT